MALLFFRTPSTIFKKARLSNHQLIRMRKRERGSERRREKARERKKKKEKEK
jgi:hypothetical protein